MPRKHRDKASCQVSHARKRALERFDLDLSRDAIMRMVGQIQAGRARHVMKQSCRVSIFEIRHEQVTLYVAYDKQRKSISTFLTRQMIEGSVIDD